MQGILDVNKQMRVHTFLDSFILRQLRHILIQKISQRLSVSQQFLVACCKLLILLMSILAQLSFRVKDTPERKDREMF